MVWIVVLATDGRGRNGGCGQRGGEKLAGPEQSEEGQGGVERRMHGRVGRAMECQWHGGEGRDCAPVGEGSETPAARRLPSGVGAANDGLDSKTALMAAVCEREGRGREKRGQRRPADIFIR